jgi:hypothetical protein
MPAAFGVPLARRAGQAAGLAGAALLAAAPFHVRFSQELRPASLSLFAMVLALWALDAFLERRPAPGDLYLACLATAWRSTWRRSFSASPGWRLLEDAAGRNRAPRAARGFSCCESSFSRCGWRACPGGPSSSRPRGGPAAASAPLAVTRGLRIPPFFTFAPDGGIRGKAGGLFALSRWRAWGSRWRARSRFLAAWAVLGFGAIETLGRSIRA